MNKLLHTAAMLAITSAVANAAPPKTGMEWYKMCNPTNESWHPRLLYVDGYASMVAT
jgi:hypothetical protein